MLTEALRWLLTPAPPAARRLGYVGESIALGARGSRCRQAWREHLSHTRHFLHASASASPGRGHGALLGSGPLQDIPLTQLAGCFRHLWLLDLVHPRPARRAARRHPGVTLLEWDATGVVDLLARDADGSCCPALPEDFAALSPPVRTPEALPRVDWLASVNLLSQLPVLPRRWLETHCRLPAHWLDSWEEHLMARHLAWLTDLNRHAAICLICDGRQSGFDPFGALRETWSPGVLGHLPEPHQRWTWQLAPPGELTDGSIRHEVVAWHWPVGALAGHGEAVPTAPPGQPEGTTAGRSPGESRQAAPAGQTKASTQHPAQGMTVT